MIFLGFLFFRTCIYDNFFSYIVEVIQLNYKCLMKMALCKGIVIVLIILEVVLAFSNGCVDMRSARYYIVPLYLINGFLGTVVYWMISIALSKAKNIFGGGFNLSQSKFHAFPRFKYVLDFCF